MFFVVEWVILVKVLLFIGEVFLKYFFFIGVVYLFFMKLLYCVLNFGGFSLF